MHLSLKGRGESLGWLPCFLSLSILIGISSLPSAHSKFVEAPGLKSHYEALYKFYKANEEKLKNFDCKVSTDRPEGLEDKDDERIYWGTLDSLAFLTGKIRKTTAEKRMKVEKLQQFLARVGYLKDPGSLVFRDRHSLTLHLSGCREEAGWRIQGEKDMDKKFQTGHTTGEKYKGQGPNPNNYLHKYTCYKTGGKKCSHTFYVITKMLPELPLGLLVREEQLAPKNSFVCTVPFCSLQVCDMPADKDVKINHRAYPPFKIYWTVPKILAKEIKPKPNITDPPTITKEWYDGPEGKKATPKANDKSSLRDDHIKFHWRNFIRKKRDADLVEKDSYQDVIKTKGYSFIDAFGEDKKAESTDDNGKKKYALQSEVEILWGDEKTMIGLYECVIEDANGVVTTPNTLHFEKNEKNYRGATHIHIMKKELLYSYFAAVACCILTAVIILVCPKKMEHDDGTPYTKDELVTPTGTPDPMKPSDSKSQQASQNASKTDNKDKGAVSAAPTTSPSQASVTKA